MMISCVFVNYWFQLSYSRTRYYMVRRLRCRTKLYLRIFSFQSERPRLKEKVCCDNCHPLVSTLQVSFVPRFICGFGQVAILMVVSVQKWHFW